MLDRHYSNLALVNCAVPCERLHWLFLLQSRTSKKRLPENAYFKSILSFAHPNQFTAPLNPNGVNINPVL